MTTLLSVLKGLFCCCFRPRENRILPENITQHNKARRRKDMKESLITLMNVPINPSGKFRIGWDMYIMLLVVIDLIVLPLQLSFGIFGDALAYQYFCNVMFLLDILFNLRTSYYKNGDLVTDTKEIMKHYAKTWLIVDLISAFPLNLIETNQQDAPTTLTRAPFFQFVRIIRLVKILRALRFLKLSKLFWKLKFYFGYSKSRSLFEILQLLTIVLLLSHWLACIWHLVAVYEIEFTTNQTWLDKRGLIDADPSERYINSLYWAVTTMLTVGYGDITPVSVAELWTTVIVMLIACGVFAFSFNTIGTILNNMSQEKVKISSKIIIINRFMEKNKLAKDIQERVRGYTEYLIEKESNRKQDEEEFFALMPENLKKDILLDMNGKLLTENTLFNQNFRLGFLKDLATKLQESSWAPGEIIPLEGEIEGDNLFYTITKGKVQLCLSKTNQTLKIITVGEYFGEISLFSDKNKNVYAKSFNYSQMYCLQKNVFLETLQDHEREKEAYCYIKDQVNLYANYSSFKIKCFACDKPNHLASNCPQLQYIPEPSYIVCLVNQEDYDFRKNFTRGTRRRRFNFKSDRDLIVAACDKFKDDILGLIPLQPFSRNSSLSFRPELKAIRSLEGCSPESNKSGNDEEVRERVENEFKQDTLSLIQEDMMEDHSNMNTSSPKPKSLRYREYSSQYVDLNNKGELTKSQLRKKKQPEIVFDRVKIYSRYFPYNNVDTVLRKINRAFEINILSPVNGTMHRSSALDASKMNNSSQRRPLRSRGSTLFGGISSLPNLFKKEKSSHESLSIVEH